MTAARYTGGEYVRDNPRWHEEDASWKAEQVARLLRDVGLAPRSVCDVGCGTGGVLRGLAPRLPDAQLVGYEIAGEALALAPYDPRVELRQGEGPPVGERYDLLLLMDVVEHVADYLGFLSRLAGVAPLLVVHVPLELSVQTVLRRRPLLEARRRVGHLHHFTRETALAAFEYAGYAIVEARVTPSGIERPPARLRSRLARTPRRLLAGWSPELAARVLGGYSLLALCRAPGAADAD